MRAIKPTSLLVVPFALLLTGSVWADVPNDPCALANPGDSCTTLDGQDGVCVDSNGVLICEEPSPTGSGGGGAATTGGGGTTSSGGDGGGETAGGDDGGCSLRAVGTSGGDAGGMLALLAGLGLWLHRRRR